MASATSKISFTCPNCAKVLRASTRPPAGKKVKCPACGEAFMPELDEEEEATAIQSSSTKVKSKAPARDEDDEDAKPRGKSKRANNEDDDDDDKPRSKKKRAEEEDEDDGPPRRKKRDDDDDDDRSIKKKKGKQKSGRGMLIALGLVLLGGGGILSCGACGIGAFVWPGFLTSKKSNLEAFVPPDANLVMGGNPKLLKAKAADLEKILRKQGMQPNAKREDIEMNSDQLLMFGNTREKFRNLTTVFVSTSADIDKLKRNPALGAPQTIGGHANIHKVSDQGKRDGFEFDYIAFQPNNVVVASNGDQQSLIATLDRGKKPAQANAALDLSRSVNSSHFWIAMTLDNQMRDDMKRDMGKKGMMPLPASVAAAIPAVDGIRGVTMTVDIQDNQDIKIAANVPCKNAEDATKVKAAVEDSWNQLKALLQVGLMFQQPGQKKVPQAFINDLTSIQFAAEGSNATARLKLTSQAIQELGKLAAEQQNFGPLPGPGPGPMPGPPPGPFPGPNPQPPIQNGPNVTPPPGAKLVKTIKFGDLKAGENSFSIASTRKGTFVTITMVSTTPANQFTNVDLYAVREDAGETPLASDLSIGPNGRVTFPSVGRFRIRVHNLGPSNTTSCLVNVYEH